MTFKKFSNSWSKLSNSWPQLLPWNAPSALQIEVDIEPPVDDEEQLSEEQLTRLGLPAHHVHYRAGQPVGTELLAKEDIQVGKPAEIRKGNSWTRVRRNRQNHVYLDTLNSKIKAFKTHSKFLNEVLIEKNI